MTAPNEPPNEHEKSSLMEMETEPAKDDRCGSRIEEEDRGKSKRTHVGIFFLLLLPLIGGLLYNFQLHNPHPSLLPSTLDALDDTSNQVGESFTKDDPDEIIFRESLNIQSGKVKEGSAISSSALAESRQSVSNFDFEANTFLRQNQWIHQDTRVGIRSGGRNYYIQQQSDGNLILYDDTFHVYWNSGVIQPLSAKRYSTVMQGDGNLVTISRINNGSPYVEWASGSSSSQSSYNLALTLHRDGMMIVRRDDRWMSWSTLSPPPTPPPTPQPNPPSAYRAYPPSPPSSSGITYTPGKLTRRENGLLLSEGLRSRLVAQTGQRVVLDGLNGFRISDQKFHVKPDGAAVFADPDTGGWIYVSNSEAKEEDYGRGLGGVGAIYFDRNGRTTGYRMIHTGTTANCSGGKTPWNTWVTCEERENGAVFQVDPYGRRGAQEMTMDRGVFEAFAYDIRDRNHPRFFVTEDKDRGPLRRFSPSVHNWDDPWQLLHAPGTIQYLVLEPQGGDKGTFRWTTNKELARTNAQMYYPFSEGIDVYGNQLFFTIKERKQLFILDLNRKTYERQSTRSGVFDGMPDQVKRIVGDEDGLLYFCEEAGNENGVHARDQNGWFFTVMESDTINDESTGLAFSPDGKHMYVAFQLAGKVFDIYREDGLPFHGQTLNVRYHSH